MKHLSRIILPVIVFSSTLWLLASASQTETGQDPEIQFQRAVQLETIEGNLNAAINLYKQVISNNGNNRAIAAKALLRLGGCYEKQGDAEATRAYEQLLRDYADQADSAAEARMRLAALSKPAGSESGPITRRVWTGPKTDYYGEVSPDGKYISFVDWDTGDLAIRDLEKGTNRRLTNKGSWEENDVDQAELSIWSPDSKQIAYQWSTLQGYELRIIRLDSPTPRVLCRGYNQNAWIDPHDWSPDGKYILATLNKNNADQQMLLVSVADGTVRELKILSERLASAAISPDGRYILYDYPQSESSLSHDIFMLPFSGGSEMPLIEYPADDLVLGWTPDGKRVLFTSDRRSSVDIWAIQIEDGKPQGSPMIVKPMVGHITPLGITRSGSFYFGVAGGRSDVYSAELNPPSGDLMAPPTKLIKHSEGFNHAPQYSPDGKYLAYISTRPRTASQVEWGNTLCIRSLETGEEREFQREVIRLGVRVFSRPRWSPEGQSVFLYGRDDRNRYGIYHINLETGKARDLLRAGEDQFVGHAEALKDERSFLYVREDRKNDRVEICIRDLNNGGEKILHSPSPAANGALAVSPDGRWVSTLVRPLTEDGMELNIVSIDSGAVKRLFKFNERDNPPSTRHSWSADSKHVYYSRRVNTQDRRKFELWRIAASGGQPQKTGLEMPGGGIFHMSAHPDGKHVAFEARVPGSPAEVWVMENFLTQGR